MWILFAFIYAFGIGIYQLLKKEMLAKSTAVVALAISSTVGFLCISWRIYDAYLIEPSMIGWMFLKGVICSCSWICFMYAIKSLELSRASLIQNLSMIISFLCGIFIFNESVMWFQVVGIVLVFIGVALSGWNKDKTIRKQQLVPILLAFASTFFSASSSLIDKYTLQHITVNQMQFWFMLFTSVVLWAIWFVLKLCKKETIKKSDFKNYWTYLAGILLVISDTFLFMAYTIEGSMLSVITVISKFSFVVTFFASLIIFKEEKSFSKYIFLAFIVAGIILVAI